MDNQQTESGSKLDPLPESEDKDFWGEAEVHTKLTPQKMFEDDKHYFVRVAGHQAYCEHCGWGFVLDSGDKVKDGHLYNKDKELVI